jgi:hypothetical protein
VSRIEDAGICFPLIGGDDKFSAVEKTVSGTAVEIFIVEEPVIGSDDAFKAFIQTFRSFFVAAQAVGKLLEREFVSGGGDRIFNISAADFCKFFLTHNFIPSESLTSLSAIIAVN